MNKTLINDGFTIVDQNGNEEIIHIPYNINNILINEKDIINILLQCNVNIENINNIDIFIQAFTHKSYYKKEVFTFNILTIAKQELGNPNNLVELQENSYERLEYLGDRVLKLIVSNYLFHRYPKQDEGFMTRLQTKIEDKKNLAFMSKELGLNKFFIISKQIESIGGRNLEKIHEDIFESFIAALYLSNGFEPCLLLITNLLETLIDYSEKLYCDNNYKDQLLRYHHYSKWKPPTYVLIHFEGPPHKRKYIMGVEKSCNEISDDNNNKNIGELKNLKNNIDNKNKFKYLKKNCISFGIGISKKEGEQNASKMALIIYGVLKEDQYSSSDIYYPNWDNMELNNEDLSNSE
jgi:ribonuclease-3